MAPHLAGRLSGDRFLRPAGVVAPEAWGSGLADELLAEAKRTSPMLDLYVNKDNTRAIRFYEKHGFVIGGEGMSLSGRPIYKMSWRR